MQTLYFHAVQAAASHAGDLHSEAPNHVTTLSPIICKEKKQKAVSLISQL